MKRPTTRPEEGRRPFRPAHSLILLGALAVVAILAATAWIVWDNHEHELAHTERELVALNYTLAEQTARALHSAELIVSGAWERLVRDRSSRYLVDERSVHTLLRARIDGAPHVRALSLIGANGKMEATSLAYPIGDTFVGDRAYFTVLENAKDDVLYVGQPLHSRVDGSSLLPLARRVPDPAGAFAGVITAAVDTDYFAELYRTLDLGPGRTISLLHQDGTLVASTANGEAEGGAAGNARALTTAAAEADAGLVETPEQFIAYRRVEGYPFVISVAATRQAALAEWRTATYRMATAAGGSSVLLAAITLLLARQLRRGEALGDALRQSEARLNGIIDSALDAIVTVDSERRIVVFNRAAEKMFRCRAGEALGSSAARFIPLPSQALDSAPSNGAGVEATDGVEAICTRADGNAFPAEVSISGVAGNERGLLTAFVRDLTRRKQAEEALRKFSRAIDQTASTVVITDPQGVIEYVNPRFVETTGYAVEDAIGKRPSMLKSGHTSPGEYEELWRTIAGGGVWHGEFHNRRKDGTLYWESAIISPIRDDSGRITHFVAIKDDITERKRAEDALRDSHRQLREMAATLHSLREEEMIRISRELHDELGQKLTGLKMDLSWLEGRLRDQTPLQDKLGGMKKLVDSTIRWARRISTSLRPLVLDDLGLIAALEWLADDFMRHAAVEVTLDIEVEQLDVDERTATAIFRIVQESLTNVARHAEATEVRIALAIEDGRLLLSITDNGKGMAADAANRARGFGLVGIRERAFMCGGEFTLSSEPDEGTTIAVSIPILPAASMEAGS